MYVKISISYNANARLIQTDLYCILYDLCCSISHDLKKFIKNLLDAQ